MKKRRFLFLIDSLVCGGAEKSLVSLLPLLDYDRYDIDKLLHDNNLADEQIVETIMQTL